MERALGLLVAAFPACAVALPGCRDRAPELAPDGAATVQETASVAVADAERDSNDTARPAETATLDATDEADAVMTSDGAPFGAAMPFDDAHWERAIGRWTFSPDGVAETDPSVMSSLLYLRAPPIRDFDASVDVMFLGEESSAGVLFRERGVDFYEDASFYQYEWYTRGSHHDRRLSLMVKAKYWIQIVEPRTPTAPYERWIRLRVRAEGDHLQTWLDGEPVFDRRDARFVRTGRIGLHAFMPRRVRFRDFTLAAL